MTKKKQAESRKACNKKQNKYGIGLNGYGMEQGKCRIIIPQDKLTSDMTADILSAITQAIMA